MITRGQTGETGAALSARQEHADEAEAIHTHWRIDPASSKVAFAIGKRLLFVKRLTVAGKFAGVQGTISLDEHDPCNSRADVTIDAASIDTQQARRDAHLRSADFFDVSRYPTLRFTSRRIEAIDPGSGEYRAAGDLTIRDVTREVQLRVRYVQSADDGGTPRMLITLSGILNRRDFGLTWSNPMIGIADELQVTIDLQAIRQR